MKLDDWYEQQYPEHSRDSCSDAQPINADVDGSGCHRCNAILFTQHGEFKKDAEHWRQECKAAREMYYEAINQRDGLLAALERSLESFEYIAKYGNSCGHSQLRIPDLKAVIASVEGET